MKALVVYESMFGNTEQVARVIAERLQELTDVTLAHACEMPSAMNADLLVVGGPTHAFGLSRPATREDAARQGQVREEAVAPGLREYLDVSPMLTGTAAAAFDTKINKSFIPGSAARSAQRQLRRLGCRILQPAESFLVNGTQGPLADGELDRARRWAADLAAALLPEGHRV
ncbi:flavodoxin family protein [Winogradskya consettensis]|uniref:Flavodoxin n=1 Tax=Winogradskya consettensis TaxID=113560 RepID=A0A919SQY8_9ACTN|nr:flavodoxin domain-containing protein [Actinoplanes consettensis]GIM76730.1 flavodoxin [Actinoplanes consettensis]